MNVAARKEWLFFKIESLLQVHYCHQKRNNFEGFFLSRPRAL